MFLENLFEGFTSFFSRHLEKRNLEFFKRFSFHALRKILRISRSDKHRMCTPVGVQHSIVKKNFLRPESYFGNDSMKSLCSLFFSKPNSEKVDTSINFSKK